MAVAVPAVKSRDLPFNPVIFLACGMGVFGVVFAIALVVHPATSGEWVAMAFAGAMAVSGLGISWNLATRGARTLRLDEAGLTAVSFTGQSIALAWGEVQNLNVYWSSQFSRVAVRRGIWVRGTKGHSKVYLAIRNNTLLPIHEELLSEAKRRGIPINEPGRPVRATA